MINKLFPPLTYSIINDNTIIEGYTIEKPDDSSTSPINYLNELKLWQQSKVTIDVDDSSRWEITNLVCKNKSLYNIHHNNPYDISFLADRIEVKEVETRCGDCNKYYQCVECNSPCGTEGHFTYTNKAFLIPEKEDITNEVPPIIMLDWNKLSLDQMVEHLRRNLMFSSSGDAKCIYHLIDFYDTHQKSYTIEQIKDAIAVFVAGEQTLDTDPFEVIINNLKK